MAPNPNDEKDTKERLKVLIDSFDDEAAFDELCHSLNIAYGKETGFLESIIFESRIAGTEIDIEDLYARLKKDTKIYL